jgi:hypothetical protein
MMQFLLFTSCVILHLLSLRKFLPVKNGIISESGVPGSSFKQLNDPTGIFIHKQTNMLYIADYLNKHIQMFQLDDNSTQGNTSIFRNVSFQCLYG